MQPRCCCCSIGKSVCREFKNAVSILSIPPTDTVSETASVWSVRVAKSYPWIKRITFDFPCKYAIFEVIRGPFQVVTRPTSPLTTQ